MKTELEQCIVCYEFLNSTEHTAITEELLEEVKFLNTNINFTRLRNSSICETCLLKIKFACKIKASYLDSQENFLKVKKEVDSMSELNVCEICKTDINLGDGNPLLDPINKTNNLMLVNYLSPKLESKFNEDPQTCELCHKSMLNFCNITNLLSVFDQGNEEPYPQTISSDNSCSETVKKELHDIKTSANVSVKVKEEQDVIENTSGIEFETIIIKNEELDLKMEYKEEPGAERKATQNEDGLNKLKILTEEELLCVQHERNYEIDKSIDNIKLYKCEICQYKAKRKSCLKKHMLVHMQPSEVEMYQCEMCSFKTKLKGSMKRHLASVHKQPVDIYRFQCNMCSYKTSKKSILKRHELIHKHLDEIKKYHCSMCKFRTKKKRYLVKHKLIHRRPKQTFPCDICNYKGDKYKLKIHRFVHIKRDEMGTFPCDKCDYKATQKCNLHTHMLSHEQCEKMFKYKTTKKRTIKNPKFIHKEPDEVFECKICKYKANRYQLKVHAIVHVERDETGRFPCDKCDFKAIRKCNLRSHMLSHKEDDMDNNLNEDMILKYEMYNF